MPEANDESPVAAMEPLRVKGYTDQSEETIGLVNENKVNEEKVLRILDKLKSRGDIDQRWLAIGRTHIEEGFMAINRSIFKPQRLQP